MAAITVVAPARAGTDHLPIGDADLPETRTTSTLAPGVTVTSIVRGDTPADPDEINTTPRGPWVVKVLTIDPKRARGRLLSTYGPDIARTEKPTELVRRAKALIGVNASFYTFSASKDYPGDPVGLGIYGGVLHSEPTTDPTESDLVYDSASGRMLIGHLRWSATVTHRDSHRRLALTAVDHPPVVPDACSTLPDQTHCTTDGDLVRISNRFGSSTPKGAGVEVVLDSRGCVVRTASTRGTALAKGQSSLQATGSDAKELKDVVSHGCVSVTQDLRDERGERVPLSGNVSGVNGRFQLTAGGKIVVPSGSGPLFGRNPRTIAGKTDDGKTVLAVLDGRQTTSVGTTTDETAAVAHSLGLVDSMNLDGGGSATMATQDGPLNHPAGSGERAVGDALVWIPRP
ncbi:hypothetical protein VV02_06605 [Luteipulveratus mongoliensis]|uniref:Phosphodiester glycosidase domain-containing protein n=1 Tax=Luteipulveratus mongoliensis TaxID=571913 RepID=A0A0K1JPR3_9MICO|nr:hypothetical protein VV02_06605 [Luteipulveratus mongoliensis]